jgi:hypothetical protein
MLSERHSQSSLPFQMLAKFGPILFSLIAGFPSALECLAIHRKDQQVCGLFLTEASSLLWPGTQSLRCLSSSLEKIPVVPHKAVAEVSKIGNL